MTRSRSRALVSVRREGQVELGRLLGELFETSDTEVRAEDPHDDSLGTAWTGYVHARGADVGWGTIACIAPLPAAAETWVTAWWRAVSAVAERAHVDVELRLIEERLTLQDADVRTLMQRRLELLKLQQGGPAVDVLTVRSLLRLNSARIESDGQVRRLAQRSPSARSAPTSRRRSHPRDGTGSCGLLVGINARLTILKAHWTSGGCPSPFTATAFRVVSLWSSTVGSRGTLPPSAPSVPDEKSMLAESACARWLANSSATLRSSPPPQIACACASMATPTGNGRGVSCQTDSTSLASTLTSSCSPTCRHVSPQRSTTRRKSTTCTAVPSSLAWTAPCLDSASCVATQGAAPRQKYVSAVVGDVVNSFDRLSH